MAIKCDITDEIIVRAMVDAALARFSHIDILVNNAGVTSFYPLIETSLKRWEAVLKVNLTGAFLCARAVLPFMMTPKSGSIINISSPAADERDGGTVPTRLAYGFAKAGYDRFTWGMAMEAGQYN